MGCRGRHNLPARTPTSSPQAVLMMNSQVVLDRVEPDEVERVLDRGLVEKIYLATLSRRPLPVEMDIALGGAGRPQRRERTLPLQPVL